MVSEPISGSEEQPLDEEVTAISDVDLQALAEEVVDLLRRELRIERERRGWHRMW